MKYTNHVNYRDRRKNLFFIRLFFFVMFIVIACGAAYIYYSIISGKSSNVQQNTTSETTSGYFAPSINVFRSPYFQFQADKTWAEVPTESTANKFVYRSLRQSLIEHELVIYVDQIPANLEANRVLPVELSAGGGELVPGQVSPHCNTVVNQAIRSPQQDVVISGVRVACDSDSTNYTVFAGISGGDTRIPMKRTTGVDARYTLLYTNLKATQDAGQLSDILTSFQSR